MAHAAHPTQVVTSRSCDRRAVRLLPPDARMAAEAAIVARPDAWPVIQGTGGARKARIGLAAITEIRTALRQSHQ